VEEVSERHFNFIQVTQNNAFNKWVAACPANNIMDVMAPFSFDEDFIS
jgi:hypothetical protein